VDGLNVTTPMNSYSREDFRPDVPALTWISLVNSTGTLTVRDSLIFEQLLNEIRTRARANKIERVFMKFND
jgi:hypothetical protein